MENLFQLLEKKEETLPPGIVKVLSWRQRIKELTWARENPVLRWCVTQKRDERNIPTPSQTSQTSDRFYSFGSNVNPTFFYTNNLLYLFSTKTDKMKKSPCKM